MDLNAIWHDHGTWSMSAARRLDGNSDVEGSIILVATDSATNGVTQHVSMDFNGQISGTVRQI